MKSGTALVATLVASTGFSIFTSFPILAQQPAAQPGTPATQSSTPAAQSPAGQPPATQQPPAGTDATGQASTAAARETPAVAMSPVSGELESALDSKTAKTGDNIVVRTKAEVKTADGTEIPKGSKLMGHVVAVKPSEAGATSQVAVQFDHLELKGGQNLAVRSQIESIGSSDNTASNGGSSAMSGPQAGAAPAGSGSNMSGSQRGSAGAPQATNSPAAAPGGNNAPAPGTVVAKNGNITIQTTALPGILLANNAPGAQDPRMATASSILLGAKKDIQLDGGTQMVVAAAAASTAGQVMRRLRLGITDVQAQIVPRWLEPARAGV